MFLVVALLLLGTTAAYLGYRWLGLPASGVVVLPLLAVGTLWNVLVLPVFLVGTAATYLVLVAVHRRTWPVARRGRAGTIAIGLLLVVSALALVPPLVDGTLALGPGVGIGSVLAAVAGVTLYRRRPARRRVDTTVGLAGLAGLFTVGTGLLWSWHTPPCLLCRVLPASWQPLVLGRSPLLTAGADGPALVAGAVSTVTVVRAVAPWLSILATGIGTLVFLYVLVSMVGDILYTANRGTERVEDLTFVLVTIASENVRDALMEAIEHNRELFDDYEFTVLIDEGAPLQRELEAMDLDLVVVPDAYDPEAIAKGRAMQYFVEHYVADDEWYAFLDDDNLIQGREFLYEIPYQEAQGRLVMNPVLVPRQGESVVTFAIDHMRTLFDCTFFRTFTGVLGRPVAGLHGELLCARGDVLRTVGFDRATIVEDFAFADELVRRGIRTWQSRTVASILSPHSLQDYYRQRARWFVGKLRWLPRSAPSTTLVTGSIQTVWLMGIFGGWLVGAIWLVFGPPAELTYLAPALLSSGFYGAIYTIGIARTGVRNLPAVLLIPVYATIEHTAPYVALLKQSDAFEVIKK